MRVVVTGASGFLGQAIVPVLRAAGHEVAALGRAQTGDLAGNVDWARHVDSAAAIVHLAALAHARNVDPYHLRAINVGATLALGRAAKAANVHLLFMSSVKSLPGDGDVGPRDSYSEAKAEAEEGLRAIAGLKLTILRPPLAYGAGVKANFLALMRAVANGVPLPLASVANRRSLVYAGNLADAVQRCIAEPAAVGKAYAVTDGAPLSTPDLCRALGAALERPARLFAFPPALLEIVPAARKLTRSLVVDDAALRRDLDWRPPFDLTEGLVRTVAWFRAARG